LEDNKNYFESLKKSVKKNLTDKGVLVHFTKGDDCLIDIICNYNGRIAMFKFLVENNLITDGMYQFRKKFYKWYYIVKRPVDALKILHGMPIEKRVDEQRVSDDKKPNKKHKEIKVDLFQEFLLNMGKRCKK
jgi:hypothetical protein